jgi:exportin-T
MRGPQTGWRFIVTVLPTFQDGRVRFVLLNALNHFWISQPRWERVPAAGRRQVIQALMAWGEQHLPQDSEEVNMVRPKYAQSLTLLFVAEYPAGWSTFFEELLQLLPRHPMHVDMFLRVLDTIDEQVVSTEFPRTQPEIVRNSNLKDAMRATAVPGIVQAWFGILSSCQQSNPKLVVQTLHVMKKYVAWIPVQYFAVPQFMSMISSFLANEKFQKEAAKVIAAVTSKGMPAVDKLELIRRFGLLQMCVAARPTRDSRFGVYMARWISELGLHVLDGLAALREAGAQPAQVAVARQMLDACVQLMCSCLKSLHPEAATEVVEFAGRYVAFLKAIASEEPRASDATALTEMLQSVARLVMFEPDFQLPSGLVRGETDDEADELEEWLEQRDKLAHIFRAVGRLRPALCSSLVRSMAEAVFAQHAQLPWSRVEVVLYLMLCLGEVLIQDGATELKHQFQPFLLLLLKHDVFGSQHFMVTKSCFEVLLRFFRYIPSNEKSLLILVQVTESRGIRHPHPAVRKRAMFTLNRLAQKFGHALVPVLPQLLSSLRGLLLPISARVQDGGYFLFQMTLYETFGLLIGQSPDDAVQPQQVEALLGPVAAELRRLVGAANAAQLSLSQMQYCLAASRLVEAATSFSKGFSGLVNRANRSKEVFVDVFAMVMALRRKRLPDEELQSKCLQLMHRMVEVLQHEFLNSLEPIVQMLLVEGGVSGAMDFMKLMGQLLNRFGVRLQGFLNAILTPLTRKVFEYVAQGEAELARQAGGGAGTAAAAVARSELGREVRELRQSYYGFLLVLCKNAELARVLLEHQALLEAVLNALRQGVVWWGQPREQREVWSIVSMLLDMWGPQHAGFRGWFLREMAPVLLQSPFAEVFPFEQGPYVATLRMMCQVQHQSLVVLGEEFRKLVMLQLAAVGCDEGTRAQYMTLLPAEDKEAFIDFYFALVRNRRKLLLTPRKH